MKPTVIEVKGLTKACGRTVAVDDLSFEVAAGTVTGFLGPNGAGKTTTMRAILGLIRPDAGETRVLGVPYRELHDAVRRVGALVEGQGFHPGRTARAHLRSLTSMAGIAAPRVEEVLDLVDLTEAADRRVGTFSLGMRQRLGLAGATRTHTRPPTMAATCDPRLEPGRATHSCPTASHICARRGQWLPESPSIAGISSSAPPHSGRQSTHNTAEYERNLN